MHTSAQPWRLLAGIGVLTLTLVFVWRLAQPHTPPAPDSTRIQVVAAENFWGDIAAQLGGNHVHITSIVTDPTADPHLYESNAQNASAVASARIVIMNGLGYDDFMSKLLAASQGQTRQVLTMSDVLQAAPGANPHLWYDIPKIHLAAQAIANALITADPEHADDYRHNMDTFDKSLKVLMDDIATIRREYPDAPVAYTEPVPAYLLAAAGQTVRTPEDFAKAIEDGNDPSPAATQAMETLVTHKQIKALLYNAQATSPVTEHIQTLAQQHDIPVVGVTETIPAHESYQAWQHAQLQALIHALQGGTR